MQLQLLIMMRRFLRYNLGTTIWSVDLFPWMASWVCDRPKKLLASISTHLCMDIDTSEYMEIFSNIHCNSCASGVCFRRSNDREMRGKRRKICQKSRCGLIKELFNLGWCECTQFCDLVFACNFYLLLLQLKNRGVSNIYMISQPRFAQDFQSAFSVRERPVKWHNLVTSKSKCKIFDRGWHKFCYKSHQCAISVHNYIICH